MMFNGTPLPGRAFACRKTIMIWVPPISEMAGLILVMAVLGNRKQKHWYSVEDTPSNRELLVYKGALS